MLYRQKMHWPKPSAGARSKPAWQAVPSSNKLNSISLFPQYSILCNSCACYLVFWQLYNDLLNDGRLADLREGHQSANMLELHALLA